jgi:Bacterial-like globin
VLLRVIEFGISPGNQRPASTQTPWRRRTAESDISHIGEGHRGYQLGGKPVTSLYEHAGGEEALHRLEELFYAKVLSDPVLKTLFPERQPDHVEHLTWFTAESFGGPHGSAESSASSM